MNEPWTLERVFASYDEAAGYRESMLLSERGNKMQIKIRRYAPVNGVEKFGVKTRAIKQAEKSK